MSSSRRVVRVGQFELALNLSGRSHAIDVECSLSLRTEIWRVFTASFTQDFILSQSREKLLATLLSPLVCLASCMLADGENNLEVFPASASPRTALRVAKNMLEKGASLVESRGADLHAMVPGTSEVLFCSRRKNVGWDPLTGDQLRARGREITTLGAHDNYCKIVRADEGARVTTLALELAARDQHLTDLEVAWEEAHARGLDPNLLCFTWQASGRTILNAETAAARGFSDRCATELRLAKRGVVVLRLTGVPTSASIEDMESLIAAAVPKRFHVLRNRAIAVLSTTHVYDGSPRGFGHNLIGHLGTRARVVSESAIEELEAVSDRVDIELRREVFTATPST